MQIKKILLIVFSVIICVGCTNKYSLTINKDGSVEEKLYINADHLFFDKYPKSSKGLVISNLLSPYLEDLNNNGYTVSPYSYNDNGGVTITKTYKSIEEYSKNSIIYKQYSKQINIIKKGNEITLSTKGKFSHSDQNQEYIPVENVSVSIKLPFVVKNHNADYDNNDTYIWNFDKKDNKEREITITYNQKKLSKASDYTVIVVLIILGVLLIVGFGFYRKIINDREKSNDL